jgi:hypothetical protein
MARPRKRKQEDHDDKPPFELGEDFVPEVVKPFVPKRYNAEGELLTDGLIGGPNSIERFDADGNRLPDVPQGLGRDPLVAQYLLPEWSKNISDALINQANIKGSPGFDPGFEQAKQVEQMTALGLSVQDIAATLRIEPKLLEKYYKYEIETSAQRINQAVAKVALQSALGGDTDMVRFWLKTRAGWKETKVTEVTGANGGPIQFSEVKQNFLSAIEAEITDIEYEDSKNNDD